MPELGGACKERAGQHQGLLRCSTAAGTVVDKEISHPLENAFYLTSHSGLKGTSRPTHYHVIIDTANLGPDVLQSFTYK